MQKSWLCVAVAIKLSALLLESAMAANGLSGTHCRDRGGDMEKGFTTRCAFPEASLDQADAYLRDHDKDARHYLTTTFPARDTKHTDDKNNVSVDLSWSTNFGQADSFLFYRFRLEGGGRQIAQC